MTRPVFADFNSDGKQDLLFSDATTKTVYWFKQTNMDATGYVRSLIPGNINTDEFFSLYFDFSGSLPTPGSNPVMIAVDNFNSGTLFISGKNEQKNSLKSDQNLIFFRQSS